MHITGPERWAGRQRWSIATRKSANIFDALAVIAIATWMGGGKKRHGQRWSSVAVLKKLWVPTFVKRTALLRFLGNGKRTAILLLNTAKENPGTASSTKASICSKHLHGIIAYTFAVRNRICKSKCCGHCWAEANSSPILMPSGRSMASTA